jgi:hypothetical protein
MTSNGVPRLQADWWRLPKSPANTSATAARSVSLRREAPQRRTCWRQTERARLQTPRRADAPQCAAPPREGGPAHPRARSFAHSMSSRACIGACRKDSLAQLLATRMQTGWHTARHASWVAAWPCMHGMVHGAAGACKSRRRAAAAAQPRSAVRQRRASQRVSCRTTAVASRRCAAAARLTAARSFCQSQATGVSSAK